MAVGGVYSAGIHHDYVIARLADAEAASLASLRDLAARRGRGWRRRPFWDADETHRLSITVTRDDSDIFHRELEERERQGLIHDGFSRPPYGSVVSIEEGKVWVHFTIWEESKLDVAEAEADLRPYLERNETTAELSAGPEREWIGVGYYLHVKIHRDFPRGATLGDAWRLGDDARTLLAIAESGAVPRRIAVDLIRGGRWGVFKGQPESDWLEAKGAPYAEANAHRGDNWRFELAKDVAAFANSPEGGIIVIGMTTQDSGDGDVITGFKEFELKQVTATTYGNYIAQHVYPRVEGFEVVRAPGGGDRRSGIAALVIPPQSPSNLPFLVRGAVSDGKILGSHVLWPVRQGNQTALLDIDGIHARLRLGDRAIQA